MKDSVAVLKDDKSVEIIENSEKAEHLGRYFASVLTRETKFRSRSVSNALETTGPVLNSKLFSISVVDRELPNLEEAKSSGADNILAKLLRESTNKAAINDGRGSNRSGRTHPAQNGVCWRQRRGSWSLGLKQQRLVAKSERDNETEIRNPDTRQICREDARNNRIRVKWQPSRDLEIC
ncbi:hypothetical protein SprV_0802500300 [Sparganum proliferum]